uniref:Uncharacterized protein n=1 Tax=viral metagenome TaxID=1070528 RepID=A0A6C0JW39_9ZZZZ
MNYVRVDFVYRFTYSPTDPIFQSVQKECISEHIEFRVRKLNVEEYDEDRDILRSPALQVYYMNTFDTTIYPEFRCLDILRRVLDRLFQEQMVWKSKQDIWESKIQQLRIAYKILKTDSQKLRQM